MRTPPVPEIVKILERERDRCADRLISAEQELRMARKKRGLPEEPKAFFPAEEHFLAIEAAVEADRQQRVFGKLDPKRYTWTGRDPASEALRNREAWTSVQARADRLLESGGIPDDRPVVATAQMILAAAAKARGKK